MTAIALMVNARRIDASVEPRMALADFLRDRLDLTGTHLGCEHGVCGACTLMIDGAPARSCITWALTCDGAEITTIEGLDDDEIVTELRAAFRREHGLQCGYCTPGMLMTARDLVRRLPDDDERAVRLGLSGNLCRCTGYVGIVRAVRSVIADRRGRGVPPQPGGGRSTLGPVGSGRSTRVVESVVRTSGASAGQTNFVATEIPDFTPATVFSEHFTVAFPPGRVFALLGDTAAVAACLPGASLTGTPTPTRADGVMRVKLGPVSAAFHGAARIDSDRDSLSGRIVGIGTDARSRSSTQGEIRYRLVPEGDGAATRIELSIGYSLRGMLAQIARPGLVRDLAARLLAEFARNLGARLSGRGPDDNSSGQPPLNAGWLFGLLVRQRARALWDRLSGRRREEGA